MELTAQELQTLMYALDDRIRTLRRMKYSVSRLAVEESVNIDMERAQALVERVATCLARCA